MSVQRDEYGKRWIQVEVEVPGRPDEVWKAIATGAGISCWFMPVGTNEKETERKVGGAIYVGTGDEKQKVGEFTEWDPPRRFVAEGHAWGPDAPRVAHAWSVEARAGGTCLVRVVNSYVADKGDWDNQLADLEGGWPRFFRILQLYMTHFRGQPCSAIHLMRPTTMSQAEAWETITRTLGLDGATEGTPWKSSVQDVTQLSGVVDRLTENPAPSAVLRLHEPVGGTGSSMAFRMGGQTLLAVSFYFYGLAASDFVVRERPKWQSWMRNTFPAR